MFEGSVDQVVAVSERVESDFSAKSGESGAHFQIGHDERVAFPCVAQKKDQVLADHVEKEANRVVDEEHAEFELLVHVLNYIAAFLGGLRDKKVVEERDEVDAGESQREVQSEEGRRNVEVEEVPVLLLRLGVVARQFEIEAQFNEEFSCCDEDDVVV